MDFDSKMDNPPSSCESSPLPVLSPSQLNSAGPLCWPAYGFAGRLAPPGQQGQRRSGSHRTLLERHYAAHPQLTPGPRPVLMSIGYFIPQMQYMIWCLLAGLDG